MGENRRRKRKSENSAKPKKWLILLSTVLVIFAVLFGSYYFISNRADSSHISFLKSVKENVDKANSANAKLVTGIEKLDYKNSKDVASLISSLSQNMELINKSLEAINKYNAIPKYLEQFKAFRDGVESNKKIYTQMTLILNSQGNKGVVAALDALDGYISETSKLYDKAAIGKVHIVLPNEILNLGGSVRSYATKALNDYEAKKMLLDQYSAYFTNMEKVVSDFQKTKSDFGTYVTAMESGNKSVGDIYIDIDKKLSDVSTIKGSYDKISVPSKLAAKHKAFDTLIKNYFTYSNDFKALLTELEEAGNDNAKLSALSDDLGELDVRYGELSNSLNEYINNFNKDKSFYQDPSNL
jgi:hypothetical protein